MATDSPDWLRRVEVNVVVNNDPVSPDPANEAAAGGIGRYEGTSQDYQTVESWTVTANKIGELKEIILMSDNFPLTEWQVTIGGVTFCSATIVRNIIPLVFGDLRLAAAAQVLVECRSTDGTSIICDAVITGKEIG